MKIKERILLRNIFISPNGFLFDRNKLISEEQLVGGIIETSNLKHANLNVHWEGVETHRTDKSDPRGDRVHQIVFLIHPEPFQLRKYQVGLKRFKISTNILHVFYQY